MRTSDAAQYTTTLTPAISIVDIICTLCSQRGR
jgi:hypothetical protein